MRAGRRQERDWERWGDRFIVTDLVVYGAILLLKRKMPEESGGCLRNQEEAGALWLGHTSYERDRG